MADKLAPIPYEAIAKVEGDPIRHIEQLWDEIHKLKERVASLQDSDKEMRKFTMGLAYKPKDDEEF